MRATAERSRCQSDPPREPTAVGPCWFNDVVLGKTGEQREAVAGEVKRLTPSLFPDKVVSVPDPQPAQRLRLARGSHAERAWGGPADADPSAPVQRLLGDQLGPHRISGSGGQPTVRETLRSEVKVAFIDSLQL